VVNGQFGVHYDRPAVNRLSVPATAVFTNDGDSYHPENGYSSTPDVLDGSYSISISMKYNRYPWQCSNQLNDAFESAIGEVGPDSAAWAASVMKGKCNLLQPLGGFREFST
jgi:hypothetical protein